MLSFKDFFKNTLTLEVLHAKGGGENKFPHPQSESPSERKQMIPAREEEANTLLVGTPTRVATAEVSLEAPQKTNIRTAVRHSRTMCGQICKGIEGSVTPRHWLHTCMLSAAHLITAERRQELRGPEIDERVEKV